MASSLFSVHTSSVSREPSPSADSDVDHIAVDDVPADHDDAATLPDVPDPDDPVTVHLGRLERAVRHVTLAFETGLQTLRDIPLTDENLDRWAAATRTLQELQVRCP